MSRHRNTWNNVYMTMLNLPEETRTFLLEILREAPFDAPLGQLLSHNWDVSKAVYSG